MNSVVQQKCDLVIKNREQVGKAFLLEGSIIKVLAGIAYAEKDMTADVDKIKECQKLLKKKQGFFSEMRGNNEIIVSTKMSLSDDPEKFIEDLITVYGKLQKGKIFGSAHRVLAALTICEADKVSEADEIIEKANEILKGMNKKHRFLTSDEDTAFAVLLAMCHKSVDEILTELENSFQILKKNFTLNDNAVYSLSQILTIYDGASEEKCEKVMNIYDCFEKAGHKYGKGYELASLGSFLELSMNKDELVSEIIETADYLKENKGFGALDMNNKMRLMIAGMIVSNVMSKDDNIAQTSVIGGALSMIIAQEAAMVAAIIATSTVASVSN
ncbi:MAG: DUF4003 domain-containing protein [Butyrivibrio sp.]|nr:DUF4003 domain-containing protein [Butyrivibrio sp.]